MSARVALAAGILAGLAALAACLGAAYWLLLPERFPVNRIEVKGSLERTTRSEIEAALPRGPGNFFIADLAELRAAAERLPWVRRVSVRRVWPDRIALEVEEHVALARWGTGEEKRALVSVLGERFAGRTDQALPAFVGPAGAEAEMAHRYRRFAAIVAPLGVAVERVVLSPRRAWQLRLDNGLHLMLGRDADLAEARLQRFVAVHEATLKNIERQHDYVDLRYPNGFALRVPDPRS